jgi:hypothetical protein
VYQAIAQLHEGVVHVLLVDADLEAVQRRGAQINIVFSGYRILALEEPDLAGVEPPVGDVLDELEAFVDQPWRRSASPARPSPSCRTTRSCTPRASACAADGAAMTPTPT